MTGELRVHPRGFGFVDGPDDASVFVPPPMVEGMLDGDIVTVSAFGPTERLTADSIELGTRTRTEVCATVVNGNAATPDPHLAHGRWKISAGRRTLEPGDLIIGTLKDATVLVTDVISAADTATQLRTRVLVRYQLSRTEPALTLDGTLSDNSRRRDLRDLTTLTIDADHSEDLDDALSVLPADETGSIRVLVHISDVTEHLVAGSPLDVAAAEAATSVYMPGWRRAMLPRAISEGSLSLLPNVDRDTLTVEFRVDPAGDVTAADIYETRTRSDLRLSYALAAEAMRGTDVDLGHRLTDHPHADTAAPEVLDALRWLRTAAARLSASRSRRGGLDAHRVDPELAIDAAGAPVPLHAQGQLPAEHSDEAAAHQLIECLMVAANESVAGWLCERGLPGVFRTHAAPGPDAAEELEEFCSQLGFAAGLGGTLTPRALAALDAQFTLAGADVATQAWELLLSKMPPAQYQTEPGIHFGLGSTAYLHFTSPIRRYADVCVHRVIKSYLSGNRDFASQHDELNELTDHLNAQSTAAKRAENQLRRTLWMCVVADEFAQDPTRKWSGRVTSVDDRGVRVVLDGTAVWGRFMFKDMGGEWELTSPGVATATDGRHLAVGELLSCTVAKVDPVATALELGSATPVRKAQRQRRQGGQGGQRRTRR